MKKIMPIAFLAILLFFACSKEELNNQDLNTSTTTNPEPISKIELNTTIENSIRKNGVFNWTTVDENILWSAAMQSDSVFAIGYQPAGTSDLNSKIHQIDIHNNEWIDVRDEILDIILQGEKNTNPNLRTEDLLPFGFPKVLPSMAVKITNFNTIVRLRNMSEVRYLESMGFTIPSMEMETSSKSSSGCGSAPNYNISSLDYQTIAPSVKQSWHHATSNVTSAWSQSTGDGVTICVIDTGASDDQDNLGSNFNSGYSSGRSVEKYSTLYSGWWWWASLQAPHDQCGHGTQMCGLATAPRGSDGNSVGIAYNADLIAVRAVEDVIISSSNEKEGVKDALILAGNRSDVKVVSMSLGTPIYSGTVADGVYYANNHGKMVFAAAGTSLTWTSWWGVIFPATMSQTVAVTGVKDGNGAMEKCSTCHSGSAVDFVMIMQRAVDNARTALTLATYANQPQHVGGSSAATASLAGIAALVFSEHPGASKTDVYNALKWNASFYPNKNNNFGWGYINAADAVNENL